MAKLSTVTAFLDQVLKPEQFKDVSHNGLQVEGKPRIKRICCGVDASMAFFEAARAHHADLLICHHGISWGDSLARITDLNYRRLKFLLENEISLYAAHLPLDAHPTYGNNACIAKALGLRGLKPFGDYHGQSIGFQGQLPKSITYGAFKNKASDLFGQAAFQSMDFGKTRIKSVAVVSGGASDLVHEAALKGIDVYVTGEPALSAYSVAEEHAINVIYGGHYATEVFGVKAIGEYLATQFDVAVEFINLAIPF